MIPNDDTEKGSGVNQMRILLATQLAAHIEDVLSRMWSGETDIDELKNFAGRVMANGIRRTTYLQTLNWSQRKTEEGGVEVDHPFDREKTVILDVSVLKSRVFKESFEADVFADFQEQFTDFHEVISAMAARLGARRPVRASETRVTSLMDELGGI